MSTRVTTHHIRAIRGRIALTGISVRELARKAGVSSSSVHTILGGQQFESKYLPKLLEAAGIATTASSEQLRLEVHLIQAMRTLIFSGDVKTLRLASRILNALGENHTDGFSKDGL